MLTATLADRNAVIVAAVANGESMEAVGRQQEKPITRERVRQICKGVGITGRWLQSLRPPSESRLQQMRGQCKREAIMRRRAAVAELRQQHLSSAQIQKQLGLSRSIEHNDALRLGLTLHKGTRFPLLQDAEFMAQHQHLNGRQLANIVGCTATNIRHARTRLETPHSRTLC